MRRIIQHFKRADRQNAQGLAEFALVLPMFLLLVFGVIEIGWLVYFYSAVFTSSRDAARYGAGAGTSVTSGTPYYFDCAGIRARAKQSGTIIKIADADISIYYDHGPDSSGNSTSIGHCDCPASEQLAPGETSCTVYNSDLHLGDRVIVKVTKNAKLVFPVFKNTTIPISSKSYRTVISGVVISGSQVVVTTTVPPVTTTVPPVTTTVPPVTTTVPPVTTTVPPVTTTVPPVTTTVPPVCNDLKYFGPYTSWDPKQWILQFQNGREATRYLTNIEVDWSSSKNISSGVIIADNNGTNYTFSNGANNSPLIKNIAFPYYPLASWYYGHFVVYFNSEGVNTTVYYFRADFSDGCSITIGSH